MKACTQCGKCCIKYGDQSLFASEQDIQMWELFNPEISAYVKNNDIWYDPISGKKLSQCPFLEALPTTANEPNIRYICGIYEDRPEDCRQYPSEIAEMIKDGCEMIEISDLGQTKQAQTKLDKLMQDSRPSKA